MMSIRTVFFLFLIALAVQACPAAPIIVVGDHRLLPDLPEQVISITVSGGELVRGLDFRIQVADGGPHPPIDGEIVGPQITAVDLVGETIFGGNHSGQVDSFRSPQLWVQTITTAPETAPDDWVVADGLLATVTVDTTGFLEGTYDLFLSETRDGSTDFGGIEAQITDGSIRIVPEPHASLVFGIGWLGIWYASRRRTG